MKIYLAYKNLKGEIVFVDSFTMMSDVYTNIYNFAAKCNYTIPYIRVFQIGAIYTIDFGSHSQFYYYVEAKNAEEAAGLFCSGGMDLDIPGANCITCGLCGAKMDLIDYSDVNAWKCEECPGVTYEYYSKESTIALDKILENPRRKVVVTQLSEMPPAFKFTLAKNTGFVIFHDPKNYVLTYDGQTLEGELERYLNPLEYQIGIKDAQFAIKDKFRDVKFHEE